MHLPEMKLQISAEGPDILAQRRYVCPPLKARHVHLPTPQAPRDFFLGDLLGLPKITKRKLLGNQLGRTVLDFPLTVR